MKNIIKDMLKKEDNIDRFYVLTILEKTSLSVKNIESRKKYTLVDSCVRWIGNKLNISQSEKDLSSKSFKGVSIEQQNIIISSIKALNNHKFTLAFKQLIEFIDLSRKKNISKKEKELIEGWCICFNHSFSKYLSEYSCFDIIPTPEENKILYPDFTKNRKTTEYVSKNVI